MSPGVSTVVLVAIGIVLFCGGTVKGAAGFGYGMVSLSLLTVVVDPQVAVVLMIIPPIAANLDLVRELGRDDVKRCGNASRCSSSARSAARFSAWRFSRGSRPPRSRS